MGGDKNNHRVFRGLAGRKCLSHISLSASSFSYKSSCPQGQLRVQSLSNRYWQKRECLCVEGSGVGKEGIPLNSIVGTILSILSLVLYFCGWKKKNPPSVFTLAKALSTTEADFQTQNRHTSQYWHPKCQKATVGSPAPGPYPPPFFVSGSQKQAGE